MLRCRSFNRYCFCRRSSSVGYSLYQEEIPRPEIMPTLAEMSDSDKSDTEEGPPEDTTTTSKDAPDKEDPFAALGMKLAKLRYALLSHLVTRYRARDIFLGGVE